METLATRFKTRAYTKLRRLNGHSQFSSFFWYNKLRNKNHYEEVFL